MRVIYIVVPVFLLFLNLVNASWGASIIVAALNSTPEAKARADVICDSVDDQVELSASFVGSKHSVEWLPGDYYLSKTLSIVPHENSVIDAEGTYLHYLPSTGDAVHVRGMLGSRLRFGVIETRSTGAAIRVRNPQANAVMSILSFTALIGHNQQGTGLYLDVSDEGLGVNRFDGLEIVGFHTGIFLMEVDPAQPGHRKNDTNWFFVSSIRECNTCIHEERNRVDDHVYRVNMDLSLSDSVGIRTGQNYGKFNVMMTQSCKVNTTALILEPGAEGNVVEIHPPIDLFNWEDNSHNKTNVILSTLRPPYKKIVTGFNEDKVKVTDIKDINGSER